jgi:alkanesulfonate monooxygenase SsuD/methylene tetrahydromethanopterin reductase-like flavin-dependent oxidoreductase (luciferase family)
MKIGIDMPTAVEGFDGTTMLEWARLADAGPFSSVGVIDRIAFPNFDGLTTLAAVAAVTKRVRLLTSVLMLPMRNATLFAKQAATIDVISNGRLTLGLSVGIREADFAATQVSLRGRGNRFDEQLATIKRIWAGEPAVEGGEPVGPMPARKGGPEILIGGWAPRAVARVGPWGDGYITGQGPDTIMKTYGMALKSWEENGREGKPRLVASVAYNLGPKALEGAEKFHNRYWAYNPGFGQRYRDSTFLTIQRIKDYADEMEALGVDELILVPCEHGVEQMHRLTEGLA